MGTCQLKFELKVQGCKLIIIFPCQGSEEYCLFCCRTNEMLCNTVCSSEWVQNAVLQADLPTIVVSAHTEVQLRKWPPCIWQQPDVRQTELRFDSTSWREFRKHGRSNR